MILLLDLCYRKDSLSSDEFVRPIARIVRSCGRSVQVRHFSEADGTEGADAVILCGTALRDNGFIAHPERFSWLTTAGVPVLGICAGMQVLVSAFGGEIVSRTEIGMTAVRVTAPDPLFSGVERFEAYELHAFSARPPASFAVLAESGACIQAVRHRELPVYGVMFHPEVRNEWVVARFIESAL